MKVCGGRWTNLDLFIIRAPEKEEVGEETGQHQIHNNNPQEEINSHIYIDNALKRYLGHWIKS